MTSTIRLQFSHASGGRQRVGDFDPDATLGALEESIVRDGLALDLPPEQGFDFVRKRDGQLLDKTRSLRHLELQNGDVISLLPHIVVARDAENLELDRLREEADRNPRLRVLEGSQPRRIKLHLDIHHPERMANGELVVGRGIQVLLCLPADYPLRQPRVQALSPSVHPNVVPTERARWMCLKRIQSLDILQFLDSLARVLSCEPQMLDLGNVHYHLDATKWLRRHIGTLPLETGSILTNQGSMAITWH